MYFKYTLSMSWVLTNVYILVWSPLPNKKKKNSHYSSCPFTVNLYHYHPTPGPGNHWPNFYYYKLVLPIIEHQYKWNHRVSSLLCLTLSLNIMFLRFIHFVACVNNSLFCLSMVFIYSPVDGIWVVSNFLAIINNHVVFLWLYVFISLRQ